MDVNEAFGKEFDALQKEANENFEELMGSIAFMQKLPAITDLGVCQQLEHAHFCIGVNAFAVCQTALKLSQLYHYTFMINDTITKEIEAEKAPDKSDLSLGE